LKKRRQRIAAELKDQRERNRQKLAEERSEIDRRHEALGESEALARQLADARRRVAELEQQLAVAESRPAVVAKPDDQSDALAEMTRRYEAAMEELTHHRQRVQQKTDEIEQKRDELDEAQAQLKRRRQRTAAEVKEQRERNREKLAKERAEIDRRREALGEAEELAGRLAEAQRRVAEVERQLAAAESRPPAAVATADQGDALAEMTRRYESAMEEVTYHKQRVQQKLDELESKREELDEAQAELKRQRQRIAAELKSQRERQRRELDERRAELDRRGGATGEAEELARELAEAREQLAQAEEQLTAPQNGRAASRPEADDDDSGEDQDTALADMTRRYELAMEDLRDQKRRVSELERQAAAGPRPAPPAPGQKLDWEAQKRQLLAALEADSDEGDEERQEEKLKIRDVISRTAAAIAEKDAEIERLNQLLAEQTSAASEVAVGAAAFADILANDELVRGERERLQQLQREWEDKLRQAEIDLSVQRAKMARERADIEERQRALQEHQSEHGDTPAGPATPPAKPQRGRWLSRLGLKEEEQ
jgi:chromosome segregation ATPase